MKMSIDLSIEDVNARYTKFIDKLLNISYLRDILKNRSITPKHFLF